MEPQVTNHDATLTPPSTHGLRFKGTGKEYFGIWIVNVLLSIITLGIYSAWAKVRSKRYFYGNTQLAGDHFEYLATPMQILIGRIIAVAALACWSLLNNLQPVVAGVVALIFVCFIPVLAVRNLRFDARMSRFRNVCFDFKGGYVEAYKVMFFYPLLGYLAVSVVVGIVGVIFFNPRTLILAIVLGSIVGLAAMVWAYAWVTAALHRYIMNNYWYGNQAFSAEIQQGQFLRIALAAALVFVVLVAVLLAVLGVTGVFSLSSLSSLTTGGTESVADIYTLMIVCYVAFALVGVIISSYSRARVHNYVLSQTRVADLALSSRMPVWGYVGLVLTNVLLTVCTLGLAYPWVRVRSVRYVSEALAVQGDLSLQQVHGSAGQGQVAIADELSNAFNIEVGAF
ncbi:hypothetical protein WH50_01325 [Pokkaliibacter plantistimulans]|uniref:DUF898 domain-containing protein n=1 Tax=Pokkaliibacter plantistimulans TaxID=1635171 RepID=A0ABX5M2A3_9GAMM|nr:hypothetical protein WH50_01325 [Pokkaliibacter plantistimulans]